MPVDADNDFAACCPLFSPTCNKTSQLRMVVGRRQQRSLLWWQHRQRAATKSATLTAATTSGELRVRSCRLTERCHSRHQRSVIVVVARYDAVASSASVASIAAASTNCRPTAALPPTDLHCYCCIQRRLGLKKVRRQKVAIFRWTAANFRRRRLWVFKIANVS